MFRYLLTALAICLTIALEASADPPVPPEASASAAPQPAPAAPPAPPQLPPVPWEKIGNDDGIAVYRREVPGSPIIALKVLHHEGRADVVVLDVLGLERCGTFPRPSTSSTTTSARPS